MKVDLRGIVVGLVAVGLVISGCASGASGTSDGSADKPAKIEKVDGSNVGRVILTAKAATSLGIQLEQVGAAAQRTTVPYAAVLYDSSGATWVYTRAADLTFVRHKITVERIDNETAVLSDGPSPGTEVVTVGAAELYGTELGVGK